MRRYLRAWVHDRGRVEECVEAEAAELGKGLNEWWAGRRSSERGIEGDKGGSGEGKDPRCRLHTNTPSFGYTGARLQDFSLC